MVSVDMNWATTNMNCTSGRAPPSERRRMSSPKSHCMTITFVVVTWRRWMLAPFVFNHSFYRGDFEVYVEQILAPTLSPCEIVIMDNLSNYRKLKARVRTKAAVAELGFLPFYSTDFNRIVALFSPP